MELSSGLLTAIRPVFAYLEQPLVVSLQKIAFEFRTLGSFASAIKKTVFCMRIFLSFLVTTWLSCLSDDHVDALRFEKIADAEVWKYRDTFLEAAERHANRFCSEESSWDKVVRKESAKQDVVKNQQAVFGVLPFCWPVSVKTDLYEHSEHIEFFGRPSFTGRQNYYRFGDEKLVSCVAMSLDKCLFLASTSQNTFILTESKKRIDHDARECLSIAPQYASVFSLGSTQFPIVSALKSGTLKITNVFRYGAGTGLGETVVFEVKADSIKEISRVPDIYPKSSIGGVGEFEVRPSLDWLIVRSTLFMQGEEHGDEIRIEYSEDEKKQPTPSIVQVGIGYKNKSLRSILERVRLMALILKSDSPNDVVAVQPFKAIQEYRRVSVLSVGHYANKGPIPTDSVRIDSSSTKSSPRLFRLLLLMSIAILAGICMMIWRRMR